MHPTCVHGPCWQCVPTQRSHAKYHISMQTRLFLLQCNTDGTEALKHLDSSHPRICHMTSLVRACSFISQPTWRAQRSKYDVNFLSQEHLKNSKSSVFGGTKATDIKLSVDDAWPCNTSKHNETLVFSYKWSQHRGWCKTFEFYRALQRKVQLMPWRFYQFVCIMAHSHRRDRIERNWIELNRSPQFSACSELVPFSSSYFCRGDVNRHLCSCAVSKLKWFLIEKFPIFNGFVDYYYTLCSEKSPPFVLQYRPNSNIAKPI